MTSANISRLTSPKASIILSTAKIKRVALNILNTRKNLRTRSTLNPGTLPNPGINTSDGKIESRSTIPKKLNIKADLSGAV